MKRTPQGLRAVRVARGLTQEQLEEKSGIPQPNISRMELVGPAPAVRTAIRLARVLRTTVENLFGEEESTMVHDSTRKRVDTD